MEAKDTTEHGRKGSLPTATGGDETFSFNGVFRDVNDQDIRKRLYFAQSQVKEGKWSEAKETLIETANTLPEGHDRRNLEIILKEVERYEKCRIGSTVNAAQCINWMDVTGRQPQIHEEKFEELPQSIFMIKPWRMSEDHNKVIVGRRLLSHQWIANNIRELHCSLVNSSMILGLMADQRVMEDGVSVNYYPFTDEEKKCYMKELMEKHEDDTEIVFPYPALETFLKTEIHCPDEGWEIDETLALQLGEGEIFLRDYTLQFLKTLQREDLYLFDPACSTGQFLSTMKNGFPNSYTAGQDLSPCMAKYAKARLDETYCANALDPQIPMETADVTFVRFINSEVLKVKTARTMVHPLLKPLKKGGYMVIFGHTPVLISASDILMDSQLKLTKCIGKDSKLDGIFQYYVCQKL